MQSRIESMNVGVINDWMEMRMMTKCGKDFIFGSTIFHELSDLSWHRRHRAMSWMPCIWSLKQKVEGIFIFLNDSFSNQLKYEMMAIPTLFGPDLLFSVPQMINFVLIISKIQNIWLTNQQNKEATPSFQNLHMESDFTENNHSSLSVLIFQDLQDNCED